MPVSPQFVFGWSSAVARAIESYGVSSAKVFESAAVRPVSHSRPSERIDLDQLRVLFDRIVEATGDPAVGLRIADYMSPTMFDALGLYLLTSPSLLVLCQKLIRFSKLIADGERLRLAEGKRCFALVGILPPEPQLPELAHMFAAFLLRVVRSISDAGYTFHEVHFRSPSSKQLRLSMRRYFGCPVRFSSEFDRILVRRDDMLRPLSGVSEGVERLHESVVVEHLARVDRTNVVAQVESVLRKSLGSGPPSKAEVARQLGLGERTLQSRLAAQGTSYQKMVNATRRALALGYIGQPQLALGEIAFRLGYQDTSNFCRAFKKWTGRSPRGHPA